MQSERESIREISFSFESLRIVHDLFVDHRIDVPIKLVTIELDEQIVEMRDKTDKVFTNDEDSF